MIEDLIDDLVLDRFTWDGISLDEAAAYGIPKQKIVKAIDRGDVIAKLHGRQWKINKNSYVAWIAERAMIGCL